MGKKIICECGSVFPLEKVKNLTECPICGASFDDFNNGEGTTCEDIPSFGEDIELGENDSFDEDKIDFWWYKIKEPSEDGTSKGRVYTNCAECGNPSYVTYPIAQTRDYLLISPRCHDKCNNCGNELKNHILSKRPSDLIDPRKHDILIKDYENTPRCPICASTNVHKISITNKAVSALAFGVLAAGHVSKTWKCDICGSKF